MSGSRSRSRRPDERGGVTLFAVACAGVLLLLGAALGVVAAMVVAHRTAQGAADLSALAAAGALDTTDPCARAAWVAAANGGRLSSCLLQDREVTVVVEVAGPRWLGQQSDLRARARAGPARPGPAR
ncbi:MAG: flp pilus-assembly TadE/G-like family protein [Nocardioides sp.]|nr:flp pilus-assembly TadE/G-like family protein [Nocardioides sp.]